MPLTLKECTDSSTFSHIVDCEWAGYYNPYHPFMQVLFPVFGATPAARAAAIQESKARQWAWHSADPTSHWLYVQNDETGEVVGGAQWHVHETNPFEEAQPKLEAYWWPEGECRRFVDEMLEQVYGPRRVKMARPHVCELCIARFFKHAVGFRILPRSSLTCRLVCNLMFVHPSHRRRGAGSLLMRWGVDKAQEKGFEIFIEGTDEGRPLYEKFGLAVMYVDHLDAYDRNPSDEWRKMEREILPMHWYFMWKPAQGVYEKGKTVVPWETGVNRR